MHHLAACLVQAFSSSAPQDERLSMCSRSSSQVITPGVESGGTKPAHCGHDGYAPISLHISSHMLPSLFCTCARRLRSEASHAFSSLFSPTCRNTGAEGDFILICSADACFLQALSSSFPQPERLSMCSRSSSHVITPGVESGGTKPAHCGQLG